MTPAYFGVIVASSLITALLTVEPWAAVLGLAIAVWGWHMIDPVVMVGVRVADVVRRRAAAIARRPTQS